MGDPSQCFQSTWTTRLVLFVLTQLARPRNRPLDHAGLSRCTACFSVSEPTWAGAAWTPEWIHLRIGGRKGTTETLGECVVGSAPPPPEKWKQDTRGMTIPATVVDADPPPGVHAAEHSHPAEFGEQFRHSSWVGGFVLVASCFTDLQQWNRGFMRPYRSTDSG